MNGGRRRVVLPLFCFLGCIAILSPIESWAQGVVTPKPCVAEPGEMTIAYGDLVECEINPVGDIDIYHFTGVAGQSVRIQVTKQTGDGLPHLELYDPSSVRIAEHASNPQAAVEVRLAATGTYTVRVHDWGFDHTMGYRIFVQRCIPPLNETPISFGQVLSGDIGFPEELDFYTFTGVAGQSVRIQVTKQTGDGLPHLELYDPSGVRIAEHASNPQAAVEVRLAATGTYTVRVHDWGFDHTLSCNVFLQCLDQCSVVPQPLTITTSSPLPAAVEGTAYSQTLAASGGSLPYSWTVSGGSLPAGLSLGSSSGTISGTPTATGSFAFTVRVTDSASATATKAFNLTISVPNPKPAITILYPASMLSGVSGFEIVINGTSFVSGASIRWNNQDRGTTFLSSTQLRAFIPATDIAAAGTASVTVFNPAPGGGASNALSFAIANPAPVLCCLDPISVVAGSPAFSLTVHGSGFVPTSALEWNGSKRTTSFVSATELRASIAASDVVSAGTANITVSTPTPGGGISSPRTISIITLAPGAPTITSLSPDVLPAGGESFTLTVNGTGFVAGSVVQFNGQDRSTTFVSNGVLKVAIPAGDIGTGFTNGVTVVNPGMSGGNSEHMNGNGTQGVASNTGVVTVLNPVPVITGTSPTSARAGSAGFSVTAEGAKFVSTSTVRWNGADRATTFTSDSRLGGVVAAGDVATEGTGSASITVSNPGPGGGTSNSLAFTIRTKKAASTALYYPRLVSSRTETTGIAVANLSGAEATLTLWAYDGAGVEVKGPEITNPASVSMAAVEQVPILDWQVFGAGLPAKSAVGWAKVESTVAKVAGFFLTFDDTLSMMDGANVSSATLTSFVLPEVEDEGFTRIHVANPDEATADLRFELYQADGTLRGEAATRKVSSNGMVVETVGELFPGVTREGSDYIRASSTKGVVAFEYLGKEGDYVEGLNGEDGNTGATVLYSPQYVAGGGYRTALSVVNLESVGGTVTLELVGDDGIPLGAAKAVAIPARGKLHITDQKFFLDSGGSLVQGYVKITSSGPKLAGSVVFGDPERKRFSSSLPLVSNLLTSAVFGQVASNGTYFTGIALLNPNEATATATIDVYDRNGKLVRTRAETIGAKRRVSKLVTQYFEDLVGQDIASGYIKVTVDKGVASFALFGTNDLSVLSAIPPQVVP